MVSVGARGAPHKSGLVLMTKEHVHFFGTSETKSFRTLWYFLAAALESSGLLKSRSGLDRGNRTSGEGAPAAMQSKILVVDDDAHIGNLVCDAFSNEKFQVECVHTAAEGTSKCAEWEPDVVLLDVMLGKDDGLQVLSELLKVRPDLAVVVMSGQSSIQLAVEAMRRGAAHYIAKPFGIRELEALLEKILEGLALKREVQSLRRDQQKAIKAMGGMIGESPALLEVRAMLAKVAMSPATTVLIQGETGTGKEVAARSVHLLSPNKAGPFVSVNCAAIPETLLESELFGHERGAFTDAKTSKRGLVEQAAGGTFFLDEIGDMPLALQAKLLRVLQERVYRPVGATRDFPVDCRIVAATNRNLVDMVAEGVFREDLYYRLQVVPVYLPPLRERGQDLQPLVEYFIEEFAQEFKRPAMRVSAANLDQLCAYDWPGNVRELRNCVERAMLLGLASIEPGIAPVNRMRKTQALTPLSKISDRNTAPVSTPPPAASAPASDEWVMRFRSPALESVERDLIQMVLTRCQGNKNQAAELLGINRTTLYRKLAQYQLEGDTKDNAEAEVKTT